jgi:hypothetical protein
MIHWTPKKWLAYYQICAHVGSPPIVAPRWMRVLFFRHGPKNIGIYEYWKGRRQTTLSYEQAHRRQFYRTGDVIMVQEFAAWRIPQMFSAFAGSSIAQAASPMQLVWVLLNKGEQKKHKVGWMLDFIKCSGPRGGGGGEVTGYQVVELGGKWYPTGQYKIWKPKAFTREWYADDKRRGYAFGLKIAILLVKISTEALGAVKSGVQTAGKTVLRKVLFKQMKKHLTLQARRRILKAVYSRLSRITLTGLAAFTKAFIGELASQNVQVRLRRRGSTAEKVNLIKPALRKAMAAFMVGVVEGTFNTKVRLHLRGSTTLSGGLLKEISNELAEIALKQLYMAPVQIITDAAVAAAEAVEAASKAGKPKSFGATLLAELKKSGLKQILAAVKGVVGGVSKSP